MESSDKGTREDSLAVLPATCDCNYREDTQGTAAL